ncbi:hypothetical protein IscW_ISCW008268 [Ixodes scapularis]|uniref:Uncharacterized protein n=1 Tax=Ixodes scapularis TaxID=6945 RepID=B7PUA7_IXOSC|nr:hypothetical protein IscW_ISCW008268 [Ixodes scapularis]|eukprot:XP_002405810.1 hypothetical protein IscW_ISCW008268 [Ixodes scapularis]
MISGNCPVRGPDAVSANPGGQGERDVAKAQHLDEASRFGKLHYHPRFHLILRLAQHITIGQEWDGH